MELDFLIFIYNARPATAGRQELSLSSKVQVLDKDGRLTIDAPSRALPADGGSDSTRIPYRDTIPLQALPPGEYFLLVSITDLSAHTTATQEIKFTSH